MRIWQAHPDAVRSLTFAPDGSALASIGAGGSVRLWDMPEAVLRASAAPAEGSPTAVAIAPDLTGFVAGRAEGVLEWWAFGPAEPIQSWQALASAATSLAFTPDMRQLIAGASRPEIALWKLKAPATSSRVRAAHPRRLATGLFPRARPGMHQLLVHPDGRTLVAVRGHPSAWSLQFDGWDLRTGDLLPSMLEWFPSDALPLQFGPCSPDGCRGRLLATIPRGVLCWDIPEHPEPGQKYRPSTWRPPSANFKEYRALACDATGRRIAIAEGDGVVRLWDVADPTSPRLELRERVAFDIGGVGRVLAFAPDGLTLAAGMASGMLAVWDVE